MVGVNREPGQAAPVGEARSRSWVAGWAGVAGMLAVGVALAVLYFHRPAGQMFFPRCSFYSITGWLCPGCGGLRSVHELLHGELGRAARCNALFVVGTPVVLAWWGWNRMRGRRTVVTPRLVWVAFVVVVVFMAVRNLPGWPSRWLVP